MLLDAAKKVSIHPQMKIIATLRFMSYGMSYDQVDELCNMSEIAVRESFIAFVESACEILGEEYLSALHEDDLRRILEINNGRGFLGYVEC